PLVSHNAPEPALSTNSYVACRQLSSIPAPDTRAGSAPGGGPRHDAPASAAESPPGCWRQSPHHPGARTAHISNPSVREPSRRPDGRRGFPALARRSPSPVATALLRLVL